MRGRRSFTLSVGVLLALVLMVVPSGGRASAKVYPCPGSVEVPHWYNPGSQALVTSIARVRCPGGEPLDIKVCIEFKADHGWRTFTGPKPCDEDHAVKGEEAVAEALMDALCGTNVYRATLTGVHGNLISDGRPEPGVQTTRQVTLTRSKGCGDQPPPEQHTPCAKQDPKTRKEPCADFPN